MSKKKFKNQNLVPQNSLKEDETKVEEQQFVEKTESIQIEGPVLEEEKEAPLVTGEKENDNSEVISNPASKPVEQSKNNTSKTSIVLLLVIVLGLLFIILDIQYLNKKKPVETPPDKSTEEIPQEWDETVSPPLNSKIIDISNFENDSSKINIHCYNKANYDNAERYPVEKDDIVKCYYDLDTTEGFKIDTLYYDFYYGSELELLEISESEDFTIKNNKVKEVFSSPSNMLDGKIEFNFRVKNAEHVEKMYIEIKNIVIKTIKNDYYRLNNVKINFLIPSNIISIYNVEEKNPPFDKYIDARSYPLLDDEYTKYTLLHEYKCQLRGCKVKSINGNYILIEDNGYVAYNYVTKESSPIPIFEPPADISIVADSKVRGVIVVEDSDDDYVPESGYYSFERDEYIIDIKEDQEIFAENGYILLTDYQNDYFLDYDGNPTVPTEKQMNRLENTDFYYLEGYGDLSGYRMYFYNKNGEALFTDNKIYRGEFEEYYAVSKSNNLLIREGKKFKEYTPDGQVLYESEEYDSFNFMGNGYIVVVDSNRMLKLIDEKENVIYEFEQLPKDYDIHWALSYYNEEEGIYILVEYENISKQQIIEYLKEEDFYEDDEDIDEYIDDYIEYGWGYEYSYNPITGKSGKDLQMIGGYAKPILYLYPEKETKVTVNFEHEDNLTTTYPKFKDEWSVTAKPNGDLYDKDGKYYYGLYWEEDLNHFVDFKEGFYVTKDNAIEFLEEKLSIIGLNDRERNEFIMYWLPILEKNGQNLVYFELTEERDSYNKINISPKPDSLLRMAIHVKKVNQKVSIKEEKITPFTRQGFTAVEWGGVLYN